MSIALDATPFDAAPSPPRATISGAALSAEMSALMLARPILATMPQLPLELYNYDRFSANISRYRFGADLYRARFDAVTSI